MNATIIGIIAIVVLALIVIAWIVYLTYQWAKDKTLDEIRDKVYDLFLDAEKKFKSDQGQQKLEWVVQKARVLLPGWLSALLSEKTLTSIIQAWFNAVKDLLDDGKLNGSAKETEQAIEEVEPTEETEKTDESGEAETNG